MFEDLNPEQRAAATHGDGPLLIVAGAGTGKTTTLAARVSWLVERGLRPERILLLTFSRRAAKEMVVRAERMAGRADAGRVFGGTFHAIANRLLRIHGRALGLSPSFTVLDQADGADVMNLLREELGFASRGRRFPRQDTNALQADILDGMRPAGTPRNLTAVGDDAQAIYGFRAATVRNILEFPNRFPGATVMKLERNYRSTTPILQLSNTVIAHAPERHAKSLWTERVGGERPVLHACFDDAEEADAVCRSILEHRERGIELK